MRTLSVAAVIATMATALHAQPLDRPLAGLNAGNVSGVRDMTVLLAGPYEYEPPCASQTPLTRPGQDSPLLSPPVHLNGRGNGPLRSGAMGATPRQLLGDPGRH
jgi:hypothetical protein